MQIAGYNLNDIANAFLVVVIGVLSWLGVRGGRGKVETAEIAGALVDNRSAEKLTLILTDQIEQLKAHGHKVSRNTEAVNQLTGEIRDLREEIIRNGGRSHL